MPKSNLSKVKVHPDDIEFFKNHLGSTVYVDDEKYIRPTITGSSVGKGFLVKITADTFTFVLNTHPYMMIVAV